VRAGVADRSWPGDTELADTIEQALTGAGLGGRIELPVDLEGLAGLLDAGAASSGGRVDLLTGEVWPEETFDESFIYGSTVSVPGR
jgi:hypothetical protein